MKGKIDPLGNSKVKVPFFIPNISSKERKSMIKVLNSNLLTNGPNLTKYEGNSKNIQSQNMLLVFLMQHQRYIFH